MQLLTDTKAIQDRAKSLYAEHYTTLYIDNDNFVNEIDGIPIHFINARENGDFIQPRIMQHASAIIHKTFPEFDFHS